MARLNEWKSVSTGVGRQSLCQLCVAPDVSNNKSRRPINSGLSSPSVISSDLVPMPLHESKQAARFTRTPHAVTTDVKHVAQNYLEAAGGSSCQV